MKGPQDYRDVIGYWAEVHELTLSLDVSGAYADGDVLADRQELANVMGNPGGSGVIHSIEVLDLDAQGKALDLVFLRSDVTLGTENAAVSISDANAAEIVTLVKVLAANYSDLGAGSKLGQPANPAKGFKCADGATSLWVGAISRGTGTYTASGIKLKITILQGM